MNAASRSELPPALDCAACPPALTSRPSSRLSSPKRFMLVAVVDSPRPAPFAALLAPPNSPRRSKESAGAALLRLARSMGSAGADSRRAGAGPAGAARKSAMGGTGSSRTASRSASKKAQTGRWSDWDRSPRAQYFLRMAPTFVWKTRSTQAGTLSLSYAAAPFWNLYVGGKRTGPSTSPTPLRMSRVAAWPWLPCSSSYWVKMVSTAGKDLSDCFVVTPSPAQPGLLFTCMFGHPFRNLLPRCSMFTPSGIDRRKLKSPASTRSSCWHSCLLSLFEAPPKQFCSTSWSCAARSTAFPWPLSRCRETTHTEVSASSSRTATAPLFPVWP
mmetsp:Transcript_34729/g.97458  ORF Transcript_34729/g.97458 Transcript_34729/m.97458 type:complete len:329 (+) Transcript_34729:461-1447(+)